MPSKQSIAYHEAGHAVAHVELRVPFKYVTITPDEAAGSLGHVQANDTPAWFDPESNTDWRRHQLYIEDQIVILWAGPAAEAKLKGRNNWRGSRSDMSTAIDLAFYVYGRTDTVEKYVSYLRSLATGFVDARWNWLCIERLAASLLERERIHAREVRKLMRQWIVEACRPGVK